LYPKPVLENKFKENPKLIEHIWNVLNDINPESLISEGRVYGGGLYKMEPKELSNVSANSILNLINIKVTKQASIECY
jgi:hypothetical protein